MGREGPVFLGGQAKSLGVITMFHSRPLLTTLAIGLLVALSAIGGAIHWGSTSMPF
jgi:hypothetical protein